MLNTLSPLQTAAVSTPRSAVEHSHNQLMLLAPEGFDRHVLFGHLVEDQDHYESLLANTQRLRGIAYLADGAIHGSDLDSEGRFQVDNDRQSWHLVAVTPEGQVGGCARLTDHPRHVRFEQTAVGRSALARCTEWGRHLKEAIEIERLRAQQQQLNFVELGGWAISEALRRTQITARIALGTFALAQALGPCIGVTTATVRHDSARLLRKLGGIPLSTSSSTLPGYFDPQYECEMEILRFDSAQPSPRYQAWIAEVGAMIAAAPVVACKRQTRRTERQRCYNWQHVAAHSASPLRMPPSASHLQAASMERHEYAS